METVRPNYIMLITRIILLLVFIYFISVIITNINFGKYRDKPDIIYIGMAAFALFPIYLFWSLLGKFKIKYSLTESLIKFQGLLGQTKIITPNEIIGFYETTLNTKFKNYNGYIYKLGNGKTIEVTEFNMQDLGEFMTFIKSYQIPCLGFKTSWYPLKRNV